MSHTKYIIVFDDVQLVVRTLFILYRWPLGGLELAPTEFVPVN